MRGAGRRSRRHAPDGSARDRRHRPRTGSIRARAASVPFALDQDARVVVLVRPVGWPTRVGGHAPRCRSRSSVNPTGCTICRRCSLAWHPVSACCRPISSCPRWRSSAGSPGERRRHPRCEAPITPRERRDPRVARRGVHHAPDRASARDLAADRRDACRASSIASSASRRGSKRSLEPRRWVSSSSTTSALSTAASAADSGRERSSNPARRTAAQRPRNDEHLSQGQDDHHDAPARPRRGRRRPLARGACRRRHARRRCGGHRAARRSRDRGRGAASDRTRPPFARRRAGRTRPRRATRRVLVDPRGAGALPVPRGARGRRERRPHDHQPSALRRRGWIRRQARRAG